MKIVIRWQDAPVIPDAIQEDLLAMTPRTFLVWEPRYLQLPNGTWEPRWKIWCELLDSTHKLAKNTRQKSDRWNTEYQCWMRLLQTYHTEEREFAQVDRGLVTGLTLADTWSDRLFYENKVEIPEAEKEATIIKNRSEMLGASSRYYHKIANPIVGRHVNSGWRHRIL